MAYLSVLWIAGIAGTRIEPGAEAPPRPNILLVMVDDMGFSDIGCYGSEIDTPNLDRLAANGLRFTQFYNAARCCPTRAALLTGLYPHQAGVGHMTGDWHLPAYRGCLNDRCVTIAQALRPAGYHTMIVGKWHVGGEPGHWPLDRGFDRFYGSPEGGGHYFRMLRNRHLVLDDQVIVPGEGWYSTDAFTEYAIKFVESAVQLKKPFFCYLAYFAPHYPLQALAPDIERYLGKYRTGWAQVRAERYRRQLEMGIIPRNCKLSPADARVPEWQTLRRQPEMDRRMAVYAAQIHRVDQGIGRIFATLQRLGIAENTLLIFLSDNGATEAGGPLGFARKDRGDPKALTGTPESYASFGLAWANVANAPFCQFKQRVHEGGIATPLIVHWPAQIRDRGVLRHQVSHVIDLMPTCLEVAGAQYPKMHKGRPILPLAGRSLVPAFDDRPLDRDTLCWEHEGNRAVRQGRWKLVALRGGKWELYDLQADRSETNNLAAGHPERVHELAVVYHAWAERCGVRPWSELPHSRK